MIAHIVLFNAKPGLRQSDILGFSQSIHKAFDGIPSIQSARIGRKVSVNPGYTRSFGHEAYEYAAVLEFVDEEALIAYLRHPLHEKLGRLFWQYCESTIISEVELVDGRDSSAVAALVK